MNAITGPSLGACAIRVLFVEDDHDYRKALAGDLSNRGFSVQGFADGASFLESLDAGVDADVVLLDWSLPKTSGIDLLSQLRRRGVNLPVVFLTGRALSAYERLAFESGALDFIDKARGVEILVRRLKRVVAAIKPVAGPRPEELIVCGRLVLRSNVSRAYWDDVDIGLTLGEYNIVHLLASNVGRYVTYRAIYDCLHYEGFIAGSGDHGYRLSVRSAIKRIRNKFRERHATFAEIELQRRRILLEKTGSHRLSGAQSTWPNTHDRPAATNPLRTPSAYGERRTLRRGLPGKPFNEHALGAALALTLHRRERRTKPDY